MSAPREKPVPPPPPVTVRGRGRTLRVTVRDGAEADARAAAASLQRQLERRAGAFFEGAPVTLELPAGAIDLVLVARLAEPLHAGGMTLVQIVSRGSGEAGAPAPSSPADPEPQAQGGAALVVRRTLRSGQRVINDGPIIVLGDVNPGAEVVSGGHVVVWGHLRGRVEAGAVYEDSRVCALNLAPTQLRIGDAIARAPEEPGRVPVPEVAREQGGGIVVDAWS